MAKKPSMESLFKKGHGIEPLVPNPYKLRIGVTPCSIMHNRPPPIEQK